MVDLQQVGDRCADFFCETISSMRAFIVVACDNLRGEAIVLIVLFVSR